MKKLWLSAIAAICLLAGSAANAGDHWRGDHDNGWHRGWDRHENYRHCDDDRWRHSDWRGYREVYYRPVPVYYHPARYYPEPVYYGQRGYRGYDDDIHGSISVNF